MTKDYLQSLLNYLGLQLFPPAIVPDDAQKFWLRSAKIPPCSEGLVDKGFSRTDRCFQNLNQV